MLNLFVVLINITASLYSIYNKGVITNIIRYCMAVPADQLARRQRYGPAAFTKT